MYFNRFTIITQKAEPASQSLQHSVGEQYRHQSIFGIIISQNSGLHVICGDQRLHGSTRDGVTVGIGLRFFKKIIDALGRFGLEKMFDPMS